MVEKGLERESDDVIVGVKAEGLKRFIVRIVMFKIIHEPEIGWYRKSGMNVVNFIISKDLLENRIKDGAGLLNPLSYYLVKVGI